MPTKPELQKELDEQGKAYGALVKELHNSQAKLEDIAKAVWDAGKENGLCSEGVAGFIEEHFGEKVKEKVFGEFVITLRVKCNTDGDLSSLCEGIDGYVDDCINGYGQIETDVVEVTENACWWRPAELERLCAKDAAARAAA